MKKLITLSLATILVVAGVSAQTNAAAAKKEKKVERKELRKLKGNVVSEGTKQQFYRDFGKIDGTQWKRTVNFDEATFTKEGKTTTAFYDDGSNLVGTTSASTFASLPEKAQKFITKKYKGYVPGQVIFYDDNEANDTDMLLYGLQFDDADSYFVSLKKGGKTTVVQVTMGGEVSYFTAM